VNNITLVNESSSYDFDKQSRLAFLRSQDGELITASETYTIETKLMDVINFVSKTLVGITGQQPTIKGLCNDHIELLAHGNQPTLVQISQETDKRPSMIARAAVTITVCGRPEVVDLALKAVDAKYAQFRMAVVKWWFKDGDDQTWRSMMLDQPKPTYPEFYPWLSDYTEYFSSFLASDATILFMLGPPGTGKTSLLRRFIYDNKLNAVVTYDEDLLASDTMYIKFMTSYDDDLLVIEDADVILTSREHSGNRLISRFLNISDGLIKFPNKKIIFTTNLHNFDNVDPALIRAGRCYGAMVFRPLTHDEACAAAWAAGVSAPNEVKKEHLLADVLNPDQKSSITTRKMGFAA
jgi:hypothetical protein